MLLNYGVSIIENNLNKIYFHGNYSKSVKLQILSVQPYVSKSDMVKHQNNSPHKDVQCGINLNPSFN